MEGARMDPTRGKRLFAFASGTPHLQTQTSTCEQCKELNGAMTNKRSCVAASAAAAGEAPPPVYRDATRARPSRIALSPPIHATQKSQNKMRSIYTGKISTIVSHADSVGGRFILAVPLSRVAVARSRSHLPSMRKWSETFRLAMPGELGIHIRILCTPRSVLCVRACRLDTVCLGHRRRPRRLYHRTFNQRYSSQEANSSRDKGTVYQGDVCSLGRCLRPSEKTCEMIDLGFIRLCSFSSRNDDR